MMYHKNRLIKAYFRVGCQLNVSVCLFAIISVVAKQAITIMWLAKTLRHTYVSYYLNFSSSLFFLIIY